MLSLRRGTVTAITERLEGLVRLEVDSRPCVAYPRLTGPVALDDDVLVNVQARELGLGSGGFHVLHANRMALADTGNARVPGCRVQLEFRALGELPGERVLSPAGADEQDLHGRAIASSPRCASTFSRARPVPINDTSTSSARSTYSTYRRAASGRRATSSIPSSGSPQPVSTS